MSTKGTIPRLCLQCGQPYLAKADLLKVGRGRYCGQNCMLRARNTSNLLPLDERFRSHVNREGSCWLWTAALNKDGYGKVQVKGHTLHSHRVAWELVAGPIPENLHVLHTCDNPACVRNDDKGWYELDGILYPRRGHLWLGSNLDNVRDMERKGRAVRGERSGMAKLTEAAINEIRERINQGESLNSIGRAFDVEGSTIASIRDGKTWTHIA